MICDVKMIQLVENALVKLAMEKVDADSSFIMQNLRGMFGIIIEALVAQDFAVLRMRPAHQQKNWPEKQPACHRHNADGVSNFCGPCK